MKKYILPIICVITLFFACEEQPIIIERPDFDSQRVVLIEELTGASCSACPSGSAAIEDFKVTYSGNIVSVAIHTYNSGALGHPINGAAYDLRTTIGDDFANFMGGIASIPAASVNRKKFDGEDLLIRPWTEWATYVQQEVNIEPKIIINNDVTFNPATREMTIEITVLPEENLTGDFRVGCLITEDHIIDGQINGTSTVADYEHNHVLRDFVSSIEGDALVSAMESGVPIQKSYTYTLPEEDGTWIADNCNVVTFVSEVNSDTGSKEILQANEVHLDD